MDNRLSNQSAFELTAEDEMTLEQMFAEMRRLNEIMRRDQAEIEKLREDTKIIDAETQQLKAETRAILARIQEVMRPC